MEKGKKQKFKYVYYVVGVSCGWSGGNTYGPFGNLSDARYYRACKVMWEGGIYDIRKEREYI